MSCPLATLGSELARCDDATRAVATEGFLRLAEIFGSLAGNASVGEARCKGLVAVSMMVGALTISRIVNDQKLSNAILREVKKAITV
jgi:TetR/AcrR family transcriptional repressor of nem operon